MMPSVFSTLVDVAQQDVMLLWLEKYGRQLEAGLLSVHKEGFFSEYHSVS